MPAVHRPSSDCLEEILQLIVLVSRGSTRRSILLRCIAHNDSQNPARQHDFKVVLALELSADIAAYLNGFPMVAYRENIFEKLGRWTSRNSFFVLLVLAYLLMRAILLFLIGR